MTPHFKLSRRRVLATAAMLAVASATTLALPTPAFAFDERSTSAINVDAKGIALKGYDPVSYFSAGGPVEGIPGLVERHEGALYLFANQANRAAFKASPGRYTPAFGGFCAMGVALEQKLDVDPKLWRVVDGRLYLNVHKEAQARWLEDVKGNVSRAESIWSRIKDRAPGSL